MPAKFQLWRVLAGLVLFAAAFGYLEAAVVSYLRSIYAPIRLHFYPAAPASELFPLLSLSQLQSLGPEHAARLRTELAREFATLLMLGSVALVAARNFRAWLAAFLFCFGIWDITFYLWLKVLLAWPASLFTWDILFLLPVPWVGPVFAPLLVSLSMIFAGFIVLRRESIGQPLRINSMAWSGIALGGCLIFISFIADFRHTAHGGYPHPFHWFLFAAGELCAILSFTYTLRAHHKS